MFCQQQSASAHMWHVYKLQECLQLLEPLVEMCISWIVCSSKCAFALPCLAVGATCRVHLCGNGGGPVGGAVVVVGFISDELVRLECMHVALCRMLLSVCYPGQKGALYMHGPTHTRPECAPSPVMQPELSQAFCCTSSCACGQQILN
jgi:hypothetical protein